MSLPAGSCHVLAHLLSCQAVPASVVGPALGLGLSVCILGERVGTVAPAGAEHPRVGNSHCLSVHLAALTLGRGLAPPKQLPVFKVLIKRDCSGPISSLCLNAAAVCACLGALPWVLGL